MGTKTKYSFVNLLKYARVDPVKWSYIPSKKDIDASFAAFEKNSG